MSSSPTPAPTFSRLLDRAMRILSQRDHSREELKGKLQLSNQRSAWMKQEAVEPIPDELLDQVVDWCQQNGWLNDQRFTERFILSRSRKGYGPQRIRMELQQKGIARDEIDQALFDTEVNWVACAANLATRKFGDPLPKDWAGKSKVQRFLMTKGFLMEDIQAIFRNFDD
ncbi:Regulatory protein RecX [Pantoea sp. AS-PWVM4]|uniref:Regulatory protein RecX n=2 Tax=Pantoea phytobeneficialis TaxID=2052056 RepID=A0ABT8XXH7_9GAMM|nr:MULTISPECIES: regulatory protein RecX [Pantoea]ERK12481.1 Regulatory protein RecX [Pantoea sp. AS-PWVM4]MDO6407555.1 regulatory protein RecX [Pantoea phytobeneficialis]